MRNLLLLLSFFVVEVVASQPLESDTLAGGCLDEVVVEATKARLGGHDGIIEVDLPGIVRDKPVTNVLEALGYIPGVTDDNGRIGLSGTSGVTLILNGEPTSMPAESLYQILYSMPVERLGKVEIMYSAPARYHVDGAVINIVLETPRPLDGLHGQIRAGYRQTRRSSYGAALAADYAEGDFVFDVSYSLSKTNDRHHEETLSDHCVAGVRHKITDDMIRNGGSLDNSVYASVAYKKFKATYTGQFSSDVHATAFSDGTFGSYISRYSYPSPKVLNNLTTRYEAPFGLTAGGDVTFYSERRSQLLNRDETQIIESENTQNVSRWHAYLDQEHKIGDWKMGYGVEYQHSRDHSSQQYAGVSSGKFDNVIGEDVANAYISVACSFGKGVSFNVSLKGEYYRNNSESDWNFVPQIGATFYKTPVSIFQLNFTSQRVYPSYWELHGGTAFINDYSSIINNPGLQPYISYSGQLSYIFRQKFSATLYVLYNPDYFVQLPYQQPDRLNLIFQTVNLDYSRSVGIQANLPFNVGKIWDFTVVANLFNNCQKADRFHDIGFDNRQWSFYGELENSLRYAPGSPVSLSLNLTYLSSGMQGPGRFGRLWKTDAGIKWQFGRKRSCEFDLKAADIFNTWNPTLRIDSSGQSYSLKVHDMGRSLSLTFVWRFNGFKPSDTSVDTSRFGTYD